MHTNNLNKAVSVALFIFVAATSMFFVGSAKADSDRNDHRDRREDRRDRHNGRRNEPKLYKVTDVNRNSVMLSFKAKKFRNETVNVIVSIKNDDTDKIMEKSMKATLDEKGNGSLRVTGLESGTKYKFKVRIMREGDDKSTRNSEDRSATTS